MSTRKRHSWPSHHRYSRMDRVNEVLREVLADEIELVAGSDLRLEMVTVTAVSCEPDLRHATVLLASLPEPARAALGEARPRLQAAVAHQVKLKRTPQLSFAPDPAVAHGERVEEILRSIHSQDEARETAGELAGGELGGGELAAGELEADGLAGGEVADEGASEPPG